MIRLYLIYIAVIIIFPNLNLYSQEWYLPKPINFVKKGSVVLGTNLQISNNGDGILESLKIENDYYGRYSPLEKLEIYLDVPVVYSKVEKFDSNLNIVDKTDKGIGDIFTSFSYETLSGDDWKIIHNLDFSLATGKNPYNNEVGLGSGHNSIGVGQTIMKVIDPIALFNYIGYQYGFSKKYSIGEVSPGGSFRLKFGSSIVLNPRIVTNISISNEFIGKTKIGNRKLQGSSSNLVYFIWGIDWRLNSVSKLSFDSILGMTKVTSDSTIIIGFSILI
jgi:hypothetical protein